MTMKQFLRKLKKTPRQWVVYEGGFLRLAKGTNLKCPITAVDGRGRAAIHYEECADRLQLDAHDRSVIVRASDYFMKHLAAEEQRVRRELLKATEAKRS